MERMLCGTVFLRKHIANSIFRGCAARYAGRVRACSTVWCETVRTDVHIRVSCF
jgi:hypothetical protein